MSILSTQPSYNNPISTTYPISNLSTQPHAIFCRRPVSIELLNAKNPGVGTTRRQFPTPGNPLFTTLFCTSISQPLTSILPSRLLFVWVGNWYLIFSDLIKRILKPHLVGSLPVTFQRELEPHELQPSAMLLPVGENLNIFNEHIYQRLLVFLRRLFKIINHRVQHLVMLFHRICHFLCVFFEYAVMYKVCVYFCNLLRQVMHNPHIVFTQLVV